MPEPKLHPNQIDGPDHRGCIRVAVKERLSPPPKIEGYYPSWVNVNMNRDPVKIVTYQPTTTNQKEQ